MKPIPQETGKPISSEIVDKYWEHFHIAGSYADQIEKRIDYIIRQIYKEAGANGFTYWYFDDASEGDQGSLHRALDKTMIGNYIVDSRGMEILDELVVILKDGSTWGLFDSFPTRWLHEDFEQELIEGKAAYIKREEDKKAKAKAKRTAKKAEKEKLKAQAAKKLTPAERKALGL